MKLTEWRREVLTRLAEYDDPVDKSWVLNGHPNNLPQLCRMGLAKKVFVPYLGDRYIITAKGRAAI
jgi:hypothetical protein